MSQGEDQLLSSAEHLIQVHRLEEADELITAALTQDPQSPLAHILRGRIQMQREDWAGLRESTRLVLELEPEFADVRGLLAVAILKDKDYVPDRRVVQVLTLRQNDSLRLAEALFHAQRAVESKPDSPGLLGVCALIHFARNDYKHALECANAGIAFDPTDSTCALVRQEVLHKLGRDNEATNSGKLVLAQEPENELIHAQLARHALSRGDYQQAIEHAGIALQIDPQLRLAQKAYWTATAHLAPGIRWLAATRTVFLRVFRIPIQILGMSPVSMFFAVVIASVALGMLSHLEWREENVFIAFGALALLAIVGLSWIVPAVIYWLLHLILFIRSPQRRAAVEPEGWSMPLALCWVVVYTALFYIIVPLKSRPRLTIPPLLAICPLIPLLFAKSRRRLLRLIAIGCSLMISSFTIIALYAAYRGNSEMPSQLLMLSGTIVLLVDVITGRFERRKGRAAKTEASARSSSKK